MSILGSTDLGDGRLALTVDVDPTSSFPAEARPGDMINFEGVWYRAGSSSSAIPEINLHNELHQMDGIDPVGRDTPSAYGIPGAGADGKLDPAWVPEFEFTPTPTAGIVPAPTGVPGNYQLRADGTWGPPSADEEDTISTTDDTWTTISTIALDDVKMTLIRCRIVAWRTNGAAWGAWLRRAAFYRNGGAAQREGTTDTPFTRVTAPTYRVAMEVSGNNAIIQVRGAIGENVNWKCTYNVLSVG